MSVSCRFSETGLAILVPTVRLKVETDEGDEITSENKVVESKNSSTISIPFDVTMTIAKAIVTLTDNNTTEIDNISVSAKPVPHTEVNLALGSSAIKADISIQNILHTELMTLTKFYGCGVVYGGYRRSIYDSHISIESVDVVSGFSTLDWKGMIGRGPKAKRVPFELPHVQVASFDVNVSYQGKIVSTEKNVVAIASFVGNEYTTSEDLTNHIALSIVSSAPTFLTNATLSGLNIVDSIGSSAGRAMLGATIAGSVAGSVVGVVAVDSVKGAISQGKSFRGVSSDSKYQFGDFTRGVMHSMQQVPDAGVTGTAASINQYTSDNKSRLAGAGGSSIGMIVGTAVAGPIGFIAGSMIGSALGSRAVTDNPSTNVNEDSANHRPTSAYPGLKSDNIATSSFSPDSAMPVNHASLQLQQQQPYQSQHNQYQYQPQQQSQQQQQPYQQSQNHQSQQQQQQPYRFGDISKRIIAQGKQQDGRSDKDGYRFGDFSRGLFGK
jgi:hypothetical protein